MDDQPAGPLSVPPRERDPIGEDARTRGAPPPQTAPPADAHAGLRSARWLILVLLVVAGLVAWVVWHAGHQAAPTGRFQSSGPMPVGTAKVEKGDMPIVLSALG